MGPYYLTALVAALGPVRRVSAVGSRSRERRTIGSGPRAGTESEVTVPTHVSALLEFAGGGSATTVFSFESPQVRLGFVEVTGTEASLVLPDPNHFDGPSRIEDGGPARQVAATGTTAGRGIGVLDMARAIRSGEPHRATGELALHVLAVMEAVEAAAAAGSPVEVAVGAPSPQALPEDWDPYGATLLPLTSSVRPRSVARRWAVRGTSCAGAGGDGRRLPGPVPKTPGSSFPASARTRSCGVWTAGASRPSGRPGLSPWAPSGTEDRAPPPVVTRPCDDRRRGRIFCTAGALAAITAGAAARAGPTQVMTCWKQGAAAYPATASACSSTSDAVDQVRVSSPARRPATSSPVLRYCSKVWLFRAQGDRLCRMSAMAVAGSWPGSIRVCATTRPERS